MECQGADDLCGRFLAGEPEYENPRWIRRIDATWGCHWRCEERFIDGAEGQATAIHMPLLPLLLSSKALCSDVMSFISQATQRVHFTDLETIDLILSPIAQHRPSKLSETQFSCEAKQCHLFTSLRNIDLILRLPIAVMNTLFVHLFERTEQTRMLPRPGGTPEGSGRQKEHGQWMRMWPNLLEMQHLRELTLWLDHDKAFGWDEVAESQILQGLSDVMPALKNQKVEVTVNLPRMEQASVGSTTFNDVLVDSETDFRIQRRVRLPWAKRWPCYIERQKDDVVWVDNGENAAPPPYVPRGHFASPFDFLDENVFRQLGYDVDCYEWETHPALGTQLFDERDYV